MDLNELRSAHPGTFAEAVEIGRAAEADRVGAHVTMGEAFGGMDIATKAIKEGTAMTATLQAEYQAAGRNKDTLTATGEDDAAAAGALDDAAATATGADAADAEAEAVLAVVQGNLGLDTPALIPGA